MATTDELLDVAVPQRTSTFRFDLRDQSLARIGTIQPYAVDKAPTISLDNTRPILRKLDNLNLSPQTTAAINPFSDRITVQMVLENGAVLALGTFLFVDASYVVRTFGEEFSGSLLDLGFILDQVTEESYGLAAGDDIDAKLADLFLAAGVTQFTIEPSGVKIGSPIAWSAFTSRLTIMGQLCALRGAYPPFFDVNGLGQVKAVPLITSVTADVTYRVGGNVYDQSIVRKANILSSPNRYKVVDTGANGGPIVGIYDVPDTAPNSFVNRGFRITKGITDQGLQDVTTAIERVRAAAAQDANNYQVVSFSGAPDPRHREFAIVDFLDGFRYREQNLTTPLTDGSQTTHTIAQAFT